MNVDLILGNDYQQLDAFQQQIEATSNHKSAVIDEKLDEKSLKGFGSLFNHEDDRGNFLSPSSADITSRLGSAKIGSSKKSIIDGKNFLSHRLRLQALARRSPIDECPIDKEMGASRKKDEDTPDLCNSVTAYPAEAKVVEEKCLSDYSNQGK